MTFLKQLASHVSADIFQLKFPSMKFFLILGIETFFLEGVLSFLRSVSERQVITHKKIEKYDS